MKKLLLILLTFQLLSCKDKEKIVITPVQTIDTLLNDTIKVHDQKFLIVPAEKIGSTSIGANTETLSTLGEPDFSDAAMGKAWLIWYGKSSQKATKLMVYTTYKDNEMKEKVVSEIRINSDNFKTKDGIGVGSSFENVRKKFPEIKEFAKYRNQRTGKDVVIYDADKTGIAFEFTNDKKDSKCIAVIVYNIGKKLNTDYLLFLPERETKNGE